MAAVQADVDKAQFHLTDFLEVPAEAQAMITAEHRGTHDQVAGRGHSDGAQGDVSGTVVSAGDPVFTVADLSSLWLIAAVNEADMSRVRPGQRVEITVRAFADRKFTGRVLRLGRTAGSADANPAGSCAGSQCRRAAEARMFATAEFETAEDRQLLQVPESAVQEVNGSRSSSFKNGIRNFHPREVTVGRQVRGSRQILSGLKPGESVVVNGAYLLKTQMMKESGN